MPKSYTTTRAALQTKILASPDGVGSDAVPCEGILRHPRREQFERLPKCEVKDHPVAALTSSDLARCKRPKMPAGAHSRLDAAADIDLQHVLVAGLG